MEVFSVFQFFEDESYEKVREWVEMEEAIKAFTHYSTSVAAKMGIVHRVIVVDSGDLIVAEWVKGKGLVWPKKEDIKDA